MTSYDTYAGQENNYNGISTGAQEAVWYQSIVSFGIQVIKKLKGQKVRLHS